MLASISLMAGCAGSYSPVTGEAGSARPFTQRVSQGQHLRIKLVSGAKVSGEFRGIVGDTLHLGYTSIVSRTQPTRRTEELSIALDDIDYLWVIEVRGPSPYLIGLVLGLSYFPMGYLF